MELQDAPRSKELTEDFALKTIFIRLLNEYN